MIRIAIRVIINAGALWVAARFIDGITLTEDVGSILFVAIVFGLINAFIRPVVLVLTFPALILTLGLFTLVINAAMLGATAWLTDSLAIDGFVPAFLGALVITVVSWALSSLLINENER
ncbi:MAG: phage holin family protein [Acidimicrobiia bacterium]|nr:phage holin family protein [Acidimicrobiia bacterium]